MVEVKAPVAGSIWVHAVKEGQAVAEEELLMTMECMKMEFPIHSPAAGVVLWLEDTGKQLDEGAVVAHVE